MRCAPYADGGYYAARIIYGLAEPLPKAEDIPLEAIQVVYISENRLTFVYDAGKAVKNVLPDLKQKMQQGGISPIDFAEAFIPNDQEEKRPNKSPQRNAGAGPAGSNEASPSRLAAPLEETARPQPPRG
jgi:hypothetical protein